MSILFLLMFRKGEKLFLLFITIITKAVSHAVSFTAFKFITKIIFCFFKIIIVCYALICISKAPNIVFIFDKFAGNLVIVTIYNFNFIIFFSFNKFKFHFLYLLFFDFLNIYMSTHIDKIINTQFIYK